MRPDTLAVFDAAQEALSKADLKFALVGASALGRFTLPRATLDMDFLVQDPGRPLDQVLPDLLLIERTRDGFLDQPAYIFEVPTRVTPVEMFVATHWLTREALAHAEPVDLPPFGAVPLLRLEDTLLLKAVVATHPSRPPGKRELDRADLRSLVAAGVVQEPARLHAAAERLGIDVVDALAQAGLPADP